MIKKKITLLCIALAVLIMSQTVAAHPSYWGDYYDIPPFLTPTQWANPSKTISTSALAIWMYNLMGREISENLLEKDFADIFSDAFNIQRRIAPKNDLTVAEAVAHLSQYAGVFISAPGFYNFRSLDSIVITSGDVVLANTRVNRLLIAESVDVDSVVLKNVRVNMLTVRGGNVIIDGGRVNRIYNETYREIIIIEAPQAKPSSEAGSFQHSITTPVSTASPMPTPQPTPTPSPTPTSQPTPIPSPTPTPQPTPIPSPTPTPELTPTTSPEPSLEPTPKPPQALNLSTEGTYTLVESINGDKMLSHNTLNHLFYYSGSTLNFLQIGDSFDVYSGAIVKKHLQGQMAYVFTNWSPSVQVVIDFNGAQSLQMVFGTMDALVSSGSRVVVSPDDRFTIYDGVVLAAGVISRNIYVEYGEVNLVSLIALSPQSGYIRVNGGRAIMDGVTDPAPLGEYRWNVNAFGWRRLN